MTGTAGTAESGRALVLESDPDIAVVDLHPASEGGGESPTQAGLLVFTATTDPRELDGVLEAGADGIVLEEGGLPELLAGLDAASRGERYVSPSIRR